MTDPHDPLDDPSDVFVDRKILQPDGTSTTRRVELTFRQLAIECWLGSGQMRLWDSLGRRSRYENQRANDPAYREIESGSGRKVSAREAMQQKRVEQQMMDLAGFPRRGRRR
jgi:hypothetical protein